MYECAHAGYLEGLMVGAEGDKAKRMKGFVGIS